MPIPQLPIRLHVDPLSPCLDGNVILDREVLIQIEELIAQHVPGMPLSFSVASVVVVCGGYTNKYPPPSTHFPLHTNCAGSKTPCPVLALLQSSKFDHGCGRWLPALHSHSFHAQIKRLCPHIPQPIPFFAAFTS